MSRSKRAAQGMATPAPRQRRSIWTGNDGSVRTGWLLAVSLLACLLAALLTRYGLVRAFDALFTAWRVNAGNIHLAPLWARALYRWHGSLATLAFAGLTMLLARWLRGVWRLEGGLFTPPGRALWRLALAGAAAALLVALLGLIPDSLRLEWPLNQPRLSATLPVVVLIALAAALGEEAFTKRLLFDGLRSRRWGIWATVLTCGVYWLTNAGYAGGVICAVNVLMLGWVGCILYARCGLWASVGFRWGWGMVNTFLLGFGGGDYAVYRLYGVSEGLLTGGDAGPMYGLWATVLLAGMIAWLLLKRKRG